MRLVPEPGAGSAFHEDAARGKPSSAFARLKELRAVTDVGGIEVEAQREAGTPVRENLAEYFEQHQTVDRPSRTREEAHAERLRGARASRALRGDVATLRAPPNAQESEEEDRQLPLFASVVLAPQEAAPARPEGMTEYTREAIEDVADALALPGVVCNNCPMAEGCPKYQASATCGYDEQLSGFPTRDANTLIPAMDMIADIQMRRAMRSVMLEARVTGGVIDPNTTRQLEIAANAKLRADGLRRPQQEASERTITVIEKTAGAPQGGILQQLLAGVMGAKRPPADQGGEIEVNPARQIIEGGSAYGVMGEGPGPAFTSANAEIAEIAEIEK